MNSPPGGGREGVGSELLWGSRESGGRCGGCRKQGLRCGEGEEQIEREGTRKKIFISFLTKYRGKKGSFVLVRARAHTHTQEHKHTHKVQRRRLSIATLRIFSDEAVERRSGTEGRCRDKRADSEAASRRDNEMERT